MIDFSGQLENLISSLAVGVGFLPLAFLRLVHGVLFGDLGWRSAGWPLGRGSGDRVWAGQAAAAGGPQAASNRFIQSCSRCQPSGRCRVISPRPWRAARAATSIRSRRSVAPRALG